jgi:hypothetical protein
MPDIKWRTALANRSRALRNTANSLMDQLQDNGLKSMLRVSVLHPLDDVDSLFLGDAAARPSLEVNEEMWLGNTESVLKLAEQEYERLNNLITRYGGPASARTIG